MESPGRGTILDMAEPTRRGISPALVLVALAVLGVVAAAIAVALGRVGWGPLAGVPPAGAWWEPTPSGAPSA